MKTFRLQLSGTLLLACWALPAAFGQIPDSPQSSEPSPGNASRGSVADESMDPIAAAVSPAVATAGPSVSDVEEGGAINVIGSDAQVVPLPAGAVFKRVVVTAGGETPIRVTAGDLLESTRDPTDRRALPVALAPTDESAVEGSLQTRLVYSNDLSRFVFGPQGVTATSRFADDITTIAVSGCPLDKYVIRVTGDRLGDGTGQGPYTVTTGLHRTCPGAGGVVIDGTQVSVEFPDNGLYELAVQIPPEIEIPLPQSLYLSVQFSRDLCGVQVGAPANVGFSMDRFDFPVIRCIATMGGFPPYPHASFYTQVFIREPCGQTFPAYKASNHAGSAYTPGTNVYFAQDITLAVPTCRLKAWEIAHKGNGIIQAELRTRLSNTDPVSGLILGTRGNCFSSGSLAQLCRFNLATPVEIPSNVFMAFRTTSTVAGPILTCLKPALGNTPNWILNYSGAAPFGQWTTVAGLETCWRALDITLYCDGQPPVGACCDMVLVDSDGESVCREHPRMNCPFPELWVEGAHCGPVCEGGDNDAQLCASNDDCPDGSCVGSFCLGGDNDSLPCTRAADCPSGSCEGGPLAHACGLSACCKPFGGCEDLSENDCNAAEPIDAVRLYRPGRFCGDHDFACPFMACFQREHPCLLPHEEPGCEVPACCVDVCEQDRFCCFVEWDDQCQRTAIELCDYLDEPTDQCYSGVPGEEAFEIPSNGSLTLSNRRATTAAGDPAFSCHPLGPDHQGAATVWLKFRATHTSAMVQTCRGEVPGVDAILGVYRAADPSTPEAACASLEEIACGAADLQCGFGFAATVCARDLIIGETYYIQLASRSESSTGIHEVDVISPCPLSPPPRPSCPPAEIEVIAPPSGVVDARTLDDYPSPDFNLVRVNAPGAALAEECWMPCDSVPYHNVTLEVTEVKGDVLSLQLRGLPGTTFGFAYYDRFGRLDTHRFTIHPADVNADGVSSPADILFLIDVLNAVRVPPWGEYSADCDRSGVVGPEDVLCVIDQFNGSHYGSWLNYNLEFSPDDCVQPCSHAQDTSCSYLAFCKAPLGLCAYRDENDDIVGVCNWKSLECPSASAPVCGCDGHSYLNECFAGAAGVSIKHLGLCPP